VAAVSAVCIAVMSFGCYANYQRFKTSASGQSAELRRIVGNRGTVTAWNVVWSQPELFFYAGLHPRVMRLDPPTVSNKDSWLILDEAELTKWRKYDKHLVLMGELRPFKHVYYVCWYSSSGAVPPVAD
jgi:hypothetical protein